MRSLILGALAGIALLVAWWWSSSPAEPNESTRAASPGPASAETTGSIERLEGSSSELAIDAVGELGARQEAEEPGGESFHVTVIAEGYESPRAMLQDLGVRAEAFLFSVEGEPRVLDHGSGEVRLDPAAPALLSLHLHHSELRRHPWDGQTGELVWRIDPAEILSRFAGVRVHFQSAEASLEGGSLSGHYLGELQALAIPSSQSFELFGFEPGWNRLTAEFPGGATWIADPILAPGEWQDFGTVLIDEPRSVSGRILGEPKASRLIELIEATGSPAGWDLGRKWRTESDEEGRFRWDDLPAGNWVLRVANRKGHKKVGLLMSDDPVAWTRNGLEVGFGHDDDNPEPQRMLTHWDGYGFSGEPESMDVLIDTRGGSVEGVRLELLPPLRWKVVAGEGEAQVYEWTVRDEQGVFIAAFRSVTEEVIHLRTWPGTVKVEIKRLEEAQSRTVTLQVEREGQTFRVQAP